MKGFILAAGRGSRLRELSATTPKALIEVAGMPMVEHVARRLIAAGVTELVINLHYLGSQIEAFVKSRNGFGISVRFSWEEELLDTGGAVRRAWPMISGSGPFFLHNVDVWSDLNLTELYHTHRTSSSVATLAVMAPNDPRGLLVDSHGNLCGLYRQDPAQRTLVREPTGAVDECGFTGIHVVDESLAPFLPDAERFSIFEPYLAACRAGKGVATYRLADHEWSDMGTPETLAALRARLQR